MLSTTRSANSLETTAASSTAEEEIIKAVKEVTFGTVEIVVHDRHITEIRQTRRKRFENIKSKN